MQRELRERVGKTVAGCCALRREEATGERVGSVRRAASRGAPATLADKNGLFSSAGVALRKSRRAAPGLGARRVPRGTPKTAPVPTPRNAGVRQDFYRFAYGHACRAAPQLPPRCARGYM